MRNAMNSDLGPKLLSHMVEAVRNAKVETDPFPHTIIADFFPQGAYNDLLDFLPGDDQYEPFAYEKHQNLAGASNRLHFRMHDEWLDRLTGEQRSFWYTLR